MPASRAARVRPTPARIALGGLALVGAIALLVATFADVLLVTAGPRTLSAASGFDRHGLALLLLAAGAIALTVLAVGRGGRTPAIGLLVLGVVALLLVVLGDVPDLDRTGVYAELGLDATTQAGTGFYAETIGGVLLLLAGGLLALTTPPREA